VLLPINFPTRRIFLAHKIMISLLTPRRVAT
jgi:hypothetical protein